MDPLVVSAFGMTKAQVDQITSDYAQLVLRIAYDATPPAGWLIKAQGNLGSLVICPKPCPKVTFATE